MLKQWDCKMKILTKEEKNWEALGTFIGIIILIQLITLWRVW